MDAAKKTIKEASYKNGVRHGLYRMFRNGVCQLILYKEEVTEAVLSYNLKFKEKLRNDEKGHFAHLKCADWVRTVEAQATDVSMEQIIQQA